MDNDVCVARKGRYYMPLRSSMSNWASKLHVSTPRKSARQYRPSLHALYLLFINENNVYVLFSCITRYNIWLWVQFKMFPRCFVKPGFAPDYFSSAWLCPYIVLSFVILFFPEIVTEWRGKLNFYAHVWKVSHIMFAR